jgi:mannose-1-phosphate guanylyltransferase/mannose-6-phosphate isomerase
MTKVTPIILCGGRGERLWPLSRKDTPKQFRKPARGQGLSYFQKTMSRYRSAAYATPLVVTNMAYRDLVQAQLGELGTEAQLLLEPAARGTGPAVLAACLFAMQQDPDALMLIVPSDHEVSGDMTANVMAARAAAQSGYIVAFGVTPRYPETGYGYIEDAGPLSADTELRRTGAFVEKPSRFRAAQLVASQQAYWASGLSLFAASTMAAEFARLAPETCTAVQEAVQSAQGDVLDAAAYLKAQRCATEDLIFQNTARLLLSRVDIKWDDIGSWAAVHQNGLSDADGNVFQGDVVALETQNSMVHGDKRLVAMLGVSDLVVVDTPDAVMITRQGKSQDVRKLVQTLRRSHRPEAEGQVRQADNLDPNEHPLRNHVSLNFGGDVDISVVQIGSRDQLEFSREGQRSVTVLSGQISVLQAGVRLCLLQGDSTSLASENSVLLSNPADETAEILVVHLPAMTRPGNTPNPTKIAAAQ